MTEITYTPNGWSKGNVLTAEKLNASENALKAVVDKVNGKTTEGNLEPSESLATKADITTEINKLDFDFTNNNNLQTLSTLSQANGKIVEVTCQEIGKANGSGNEATFGIIKAGTNLSANNGTLSVIDNPNFAGNLTVSGTSTLNSTVAITNTNSLENALEVTGKSIFSGRTQIGTITDVQGSSATVGNDLIVIYSKNIQFGIPNNVPANNNAVTNFYGTTNINGILNIGKATVDNEITTYTGTVTFNANNTTIHGNTTIDALTATLIGDTTIGTTASNNILHGTTTIDNLIVGTATTSNGKTTYSGTATFNVPQVVLHGNILLDTYYSRLTVYNINIGSTTARQNTFASGVDRTLIVGMDNTASQGDSIIYGIGNTVAGINSMAGGRDCHVNGIDAFALGEGTIANYKAQYALGAYNIADATEGNTDDPGTYIEIIGNGISDSNRSNARTLDWNGNEWLAGNLNINGTSIMTSASINNILSLSPQTGTYCTTEYNLFQTANELIFNAEVSNSSFNQITNGTYTLFNFDPNGSKLYIGSFSTTINTTKLLYLNSANGIEISSGDGTIDMQNNLNIRNNSQIVFVDNNNNRVNLTAADVQAIKTFCGL